MIEDATAGRGVPVGEAVPEPRTPSWPRRLLSAALAAVVITAIFGFALPRFAGYSEAWSAIAAMSPVQAGLLLALAAGRLAVPPTQQMAGLPHLRFWPAFGTNMWGTALSNTVPAGGALGVGVTYQMLISWGATASGVTRQLVVTGIWNALIKLAMPVSAVAVLALFAQVTGAWVGVAAIGLAALTAALVLFGLVLRSVRSARAAGDLCGRVVSWFLGLFHKGPVRDWGDRFVAFNRDTGSLVRERKASLTGTTIGIELSFFVLLLASVRFVGITSTSIDTAQVYAAYVFSRLLQLIPLTPGGLGVVQLGLTGSLVAFGAPNHEAAAATLVYTALTWFPPIPAGVVSFLVWRARKPRHRPPSWVRTRSDRIGSAPSPGGGGTRLGDQCGVGQVPGHPEGGDGDEGGDE